MKNKKMGLLCFPLLMVLSLAGCGTVGEGSGYSSEHLVDVFQSNAKTYDGYKQHATLKSNKAFDVDVLDGKYISKYGISIQKNEEGKIVFRNIIHDVDILKTDATDMSSLKITSREYNDTILFMVKSNNGKVVMFDSLGNEIKGVEEEAFSKLKIVKRNDIWYLKDEHISNVYRYYKLGDNGYERTSLIPEEIDESYPNEFEYPSKDEIFHGELKINLEKLGAKGYSGYAGENGLFTIYLNNTPVANYYVPVGSDFIDFVGTNIYYQNSYEVDQLSNHFDYYSESGKKQILKTNKIDMLTGEIEEIKFNYLISSSNLLKDKDGNFTISEMDVSPIKDQVLMKEKTYLFDQHLNFISDATGINLSRLIKTKNGYYDQANKVIYNDNAVAISYLNSFEEVHYYEASDLFAIMKNNFWGAIDSTGKLVFEMKYDQIIGNQTSNNILYSLDKVETAYNVKENKVIYSHDYRVENCFSIDGMVYNTLLALVTTDESFTFEDLDGQVAVGDFKVDEEEPFQNCYVSNSMDERTNLVLVKKDGVNEFSKFVFVVDEQGINCKSIQFSIA